MSFTSADEFLDTCIGPALAHVADVYGEFSPEWCDFENEVHYRRDVGDLQTACTLVARALRDWSLKHGGQHVEFG